VPVQGCTLPLPVPLSTSLRNTAYLHEQWSDECIHLEGFNFLTALFLTFRNELGFITYRLVNITDKHTRTHARTHMQIHAHVFGYCVGILNNKQLRYLYALSI